MQAFKVAMAFVALLGQWLFSLCVGTTSGTCVALELVWPEITLDQDCQSQGFLYWSFEACCTHAHAKEIHEVMCVYGVLEP